MRLATFIEHLQRLADHPDVGPDIEVTVNTKWDDGCQYAPNIGIYVHAISREQSWHPETWSVFEKKPGESMVRDPLWAPDGRVDDEATYEEWKKAPKMLALSEHGPGYDFQDDPVVHFRGVALDLPREIPAKYPPEKCERCGRGKETRRLVNRIVTCDACFEGMRNRR